MINVLILIMAEGSILVLLFNLAAKLLAMRSCPTIQGSKRRVWRQKFLCGQFVTWKCTFVRDNLKTELSSDFSFLPLEVIFTIVYVRKGGHAGCSSAGEVREAVLQL